MGIVSDIFMGSIEKDWAVIARVSASNRIRTPANASMFESWPATDYVEEEARLQLEFADFHHCSSAIFVDISCNMQLAVASQVKVWNATVSNLTLMALGSSAPEILLSAGALAHAILQEAPPKRCI